MFSSRVRTWPRPRSTRLAENATKIIEDNGGKVVKTETWGLKSLAYKIAKNRKAHYVMLDVDAPPAALPSSSARPTSTRT
jgi:ribosomal protein S6